MVYNFFNFFALWIGCGSSAHCPTTPQHMCARARLRFCLGLYDHDCSICPRSCRFDGVVGYRICLTHRRPPVRARVEPFLSRQHFLFFFFESVLFSLDRITPALYYVTICVYFFLDCKMRRSLTVFAANGVALTGYSGVFYKYSYRCASDLVKNCPTFRISDESYVAMTSGTGTW